MVSMSTPTLGTTASRDPNRVLPKGESIGRYTSYLDAQKAVDYLADNKFAVQQVAIIGNDLKSVERVTGRLSYPRVALASAASGAWFGLFVGLILGLFAGSDMISTVPSSIALGAIFWLLFGVITYALQRGKRDFTSVSQVVATSYDVIVEPGLAGEARRLLQKLPMNNQARDRYRSSPCRARPIVRRRGTIPIPVSRARPSRSSMGRSEAPRRRGAQDLPMPGPPAPGPPARGGASSPTCRTDARSTG
jgi:hypothetical protein